MRRRVRRQQNNDQAIYAPVAQSKLMRTNKAQISGSRYSDDGRIIVRHREYIADISGSVAFSATSFSINPGLPGSFPWASQLCFDYESYLFVRLSFEFETAKSTATSGSLMLAIDFDAADDAPTSKSQMMSYHNAVRSPVWSECCYESDRNDLQKFGVQRYLRYGALAANRDIKTYDVGNLFVGTQGCADTTVLGELYVTYELVLMTPQFSLTSMINAFSAKIVGATGISRSAPFGTAAVVTGGLSVSALNGTITFNRIGKFIMTYYAAGTVFNGTPVNTGTAFSASGSNLNDGAAINNIGWWYVVVTAIGQTVILDWTTVATTVTAASVWIGAFDYAIA